MPLAVVSHLTHFLTMMILRWRHAGKTCSGDYLSDPSRFSLFEAVPPYLHNAGSFLFYAILSQFFGLVAGLAGLGFLIGVDTDF